MKNSILFKYLKLLDKRLPIYLFAVISLTAFNAFFDVCQAMLTKQVFDVASKGFISNEDKILFLVNIIIGFLLVIIAIISMKVYNDEAKKGALNVKKIVFLKSMRLPIQYHDKHHSSDFISKFTYETDKASEIYTSRLRRILAPMISVFIYLVTMLKLNIELTIIY